MGETRHGHALGTSAIEMAFGVDVKRNRRALTTALTKVRYAHGRFGPILDLGRMQNDELAHSRRVVKDKQLTISIPSWGNQMKVVRELFVI